MRCWFRYSQSDIDGNHKAIPSIAAHKMAYRRNADQPRRALDLREPLGVELNVILSARLTGTSGQLSTDQDRFTASRQIDNLILVAAARLPWPCERDGSS